METITTLQKNASINVDAFNKLVTGHSTYVKLRQEGKDIDPQLIKNFVTFPLSDNPYAD